jgi:hypothetical protein
MSPNEFDLRAALHDGDDGDSALDVDQLIHSARTHAAQRRVRLISGAAIAAVVAGIATGGTLLATSGNGPSHTGAERAAGSAGQHSERVLSGGGGGVHASASRPAPARAAKSAARSVVAASEPRPAGSVRCPSRLPQHLLPGGGSAGQFGAGGPLFSKPVVATVVCSYGSAMQPPGRREHPARLVLTDGAAKRLAASLENAPKSRPQVMCPDIRGMNDHSIAIIGVTAGGAKVGTVTTTIGASQCDVMATNGTAVRYDWTPPNDVRQRLLVLVPAAPPVSTAAASPTRSASEREAEQAAASGRLGREWAVAAHSRPHGPVAPSEAAKAARAAVRARRRRRNTCGGRDDVRADRCSQRGQPAFRDLWQHVAEHREP